MGRKTFSGCPNGVGLTEEERSNALAQLEALSLSGGRRIWLD